jgi:hypothetical protein
MALGLLLAGCGGSGQYAAEPDTAGPRPGPSREYDPDRDGSIFGEGGASLSALSDGTLFDLDGDDGEGAGVAVNKYLWRAALDTLAFLPLASTDPFTGVIATDWGATPDAPGERFKVTAYLMSPDLSAAALKVAVFREELGENNVWMPAPVNPETPRQIEDAILTRARQIRIADLGGGTSG